MLKFHTNENDKFYKKRNLKILAQWKKETNLEHLKKYRTKHTHTETHTQNEANNNILI